MTYHQKAGDFDDLTRLQSNPFPTQKMELLISSDNGIVILCLKKMDSNPVLYSIELCVLASSTL